jgi:hypothetical protein
MYCSSSHRRFERGIAVTEMSAFGYALYPPWRLLERGRPGGFAFQKFICRFLIDQSSQAS